MDTQSEKLPGSGGHQWDLVERVSLGAAMKRSPRMQQLLRYLCQCALESPGEPVSEQQVGVEVYGRPPGYSAEGDTIVRTQISQLRKRLLQHFLSEGNDEPVVIEIPIGSYLPVFRPRQQPPAALRPPEMPVPSLATDWRRKSPIAWIVAGVLAVVCGWLVWQNGHLRAERSVLAISQSPYLDHLWRQLFENDKKTTIVTSDSNIMFFSNWSQDPITLEEYRSPDYPGVLLKKIPNPDARNIFEHYMHTYLTGSQDTFTAVRLARVADQHRIPFAVIDARHFGPQPQTNIVLLGHRKANPWTELYDDQLNFIYEWDSKAYKGLLRNRDPRPGESKIYQASTGGSTYATVSYLPGSEGTVVIIGGSDMTGTDAGGHFLTDENAIRQLHIALGADLSHPLPHFEALLQARRAGNAAYDPQLIAVRVLDHNASGRG